MCWSSIKIVSFLSATLLIVHSESEVEVRLLEWMRGRESIFILSNSITSTTTCNESIWEIIHDTQEEKIFWGNMLVYMVLWSFSIYRWNLYRDKKVISIHVSCFLLSTETEWCVVNCFVHRKLIQFFLSNLLEILSQVMRSCICTWLQPVAAITLHVVKKPDNWVTIFCF